MENLLKSFELEAEVLNALAHPARLQIMDLMRDGEVCVCHIQAMIGQRQAYVSQHLNVLRQAGLVISRKDGLRVYYQASNLQVFSLMDQVVELVQRSGKSFSTSRKTMPVHYPAVCNCPQCAEKAGLSLSSIKEMGSI